MPKARRSFDVKPTIFSLCFSLALTATLIGFTGGGNDTSAVLTEAERVDARAVVSAVSGRQLLSPALTDQSESSETLSVAKAGVATRIVPPANDGQVEALTDGAVDEPQDRTTKIDDQSTGGADLPQDVVDAEDVVLVSSPVISTTPTTAPLGPSPQPSAATTTALPRVSPPSTGGAAPVVTTATRRPPPNTTAAPIRSSTTTSRPPRATTTTRAPAPTPTPAQEGFTVAQVIDGTIGAGDGSNPNEEAPMGRHEASLFLPQGWDWAQGTTRNSQWGNLGSTQFAEFRCAVIPENGHTPPADFRINFREGAYYQFAGGSWSKAFDVALDSPTNGAYLGSAGQVNGDPFSSGKGSINWRQEADGSYSAPWNSAALMMHFWAGERRSPASGQTAEFLTSEMRLQQPDGKTVDLSQVRVLFQCGIDYYNTTGGQGTRVPGPGIAKYQRLTPAWEPGLWITLPGNAAANTVADFRVWLEANLPPGVSR